MGGGERRGGRALEEPAACAGLCRERCRVSGMTPSVRRPLGTPEAGLKGTSQASSERSERRFRTPPFRPSATPPSTVRCPIRSGMTITSRITTAGRVTVKTEGIEQGRLTAQGWHQSASDTSNIFCSMPVPSQFCHCKRAYTPSL